MKIRLISNNADFCDDLQLQLTKYLPNCVLINEGVPDIAVIDEDLQMLKSMRQQYPAVPLILLTPDNMPTADRLNLILHKPFSLNRLIDMLSTANINLDNSADGYLQFNQYELRPSERKIINLFTGEEVKLTEKEVDIIKYLYKNTQHYVSKSDLQTNVWQYNDEVTTHTVETHIYRLRQKVEKDGADKLIITDNGKYKLNLG